MNKLMLFPLLILSVCTVYAFLGGGNVTGGSATIDANGEVIVNGSSSTFESPAGGVFEFDLFTGDGLLVVLFLIIIAGVLLGITVFGSGLSEMAQNLAFKGLVFFGVWAALVLFSADVITEGTGIYGVLLYFGLTLLYGIGFASDVSSSGSGN